MCIYTENSEQSICAPEIEDSEHDGYDEDADPLESPPLIVPRLGVRCRASKDKIWKDLIAKYSRLVSDEDGNRCFCKLC